MKTVKEVEVDGKTWKMQREIEIDNEIWEIEIGHIDWRYGTVTYTATCRTNRDYETVYFLDCMIEGDAEEWIREWIRKFRETGEERAEREADEMLRSYYEWEEERGSPIL